MTPMNATTNITIKKLPQFSAARCKRCGICSHFCAVNAIATRAHSTNACRGPRQAVVDGLAEAVPGNGHDGNALSAGRIGLLQHVEKIGCRLGKIALLAQIEDCDRPLRMCGAPAPESQLGLSRQDFRRIEPHGR